MKNNNIKIYRGGLKCRNKYHSFDHLTMLMQMINVPDCVLDKVSYDSSCGFIFKLNAPESTDPESLPFLNLNKEGSNYNVPVFSIILKLTLLYQDARSESRIYIPQRYVDKENRAYSHRFNKQSEFINETKALNKIYKKTMLSGASICPSILLSLIFNNDPAKIILDKLNRVSSRSGDDNESHRMIEYILNQINSDKDIVLGIIAMESIIEYKTIEELITRTSLDNINKYITENPEPEVLSEDTELDEDIDEDLIKEVTLVVNENPTSVSKSIQPKSKIIAPVDKEFIYCNVLFNILRTFYESGFINLDLHRNNAMGLLDFDQMELNIKIIDFESIDDGDMEDIMFDDYYETMIGYKKITPEKIQNDLVSIFNVTTTIYNEFVSKKMRDEVENGYRVNGMYLQLIKSEYINSIARCFHEFSVDYIKKSKYFKINMLSAFNCYGEIKIQTVDAIPVDSIRDEKMALVLLENRVRKKRAKSKRQRKNKKRRSVAKSRKTV